MESVTYAESMRLRIPTPRPPSTVTMSRANAPLLSAGVGNFAIQRPRRDIYIDLTASRSGGGLHGAQKRRLNGISTAVCHTSADCLAWRTRTADSLLHDGGRAG